MKIMSIVKEGWDAIQTKCFTESSEAGWWDGVSDADLALVVPVKLCLIHSEISEAMEGHRNGLKDAIIRIGDLAGRLGLDVGGAIVEKMAYNQTRNDHKREVRAAEGGKKY
jgi:hypothetical protein